MSFSTHNKKTSGNNRSSFSPGLSASTTSRTVGLSSGSPVEESRTDIQRPVNHTCDLQPFHVTNRLMFQDTLHSTPFRGCYRATNYRSSTANPYNSESTQGIPGINGLRTYENDQLTRALDQDDGESRNVNAETLSQMAESICANMPDSVQYDEGHAMHAFHHLMDLYQSQELCDVILHIYAGDGVPNTSTPTTITSPSESSAPISGASQGQNDSTLAQPYIIPCHRVVLACFSAYFAAMFKSNMRESQSFIVPMYNMEYSAMLTLVRFCYTGELLLSPTNIIPIMHTACVLQMERAIPLCEQYVLSHLRVEHVLDIRKFAHLYHLQNLLSEVDRFIAINFILLMEEHHGLKDMTYQMLCVVLRHPQLTVNSEEQLATRVLQWVAYDITRRAYFPRLILLLRLLQLPYDFLDCCIFTRDVYANRCAEIYCRSVLRLKNMARAEEPRLIENMSRALLRVLGPLERHLRMNTPNGNEEFNLTSSRPESPLQTEMMEGVEDQEPIDVVPVVESVVKDESREFLDPGISDHSHLVNSIHRAMGIGVQSRHVNEIITRVLDDPQSNNGEIVQDHRGDIDDMEGTYGSTADDPNESSIDEVETAPNEYGQQDPGQTTLNAGHGQESTNYAVREEALNFMSNLNNSSASANLQPMSLFRTATMALGSQNPMNLVSGPTANSSSPLDYSPSIVLRTSRGVVTPESSFSSNASPQRPHCGRGGCILPPSHYHGGNTLLLANYPLEYWRCTCSRTATTTATSTNSTISQSTDRTTSVTPSTVVSSNAFRDANQLGMNPVPSTSDERQSRNRDAVTLNEELFHTAGLPSSEEQDDHLRLFPPIFASVNSDNEYDSRYLEEYVELMRPRPCYSGVVLCVGGRGCPNTPYAEAEVYDPLTDTWSSMVKMLTPRRHVGLIAHGTEVVAIGGHDGRRHLASGEKFSIVDGKWTHMQPMHTARRGLALAWLGNCLFCLGGLDDSTCFKTVERFSFTTNQWSNVNSMRSPRGGLAVTTLCDKIIAIGGNDSHTSVNSCEMFDPIAQTWLCMPPMSDKRAGASAAQVDGIVYVVGGFDDNMPLSSIEQYDPREGRWRHMSPMQHARGGVGAASLGGKVYAIGGHNGESYLSSTEVFDPCMNRWRESASLKTQRAGGGVCSFDIPLRNIFPSVS